MVLKSRLKSLRQSLLRNNVFNMCVFNTKQNCVSKIISIVSTIISRICNVQNRQHAQRMLQHAQSMPKHAPNMLFRSLWSLENTAPAKGILRIHQSRCRLSFRCVLGARESSRKSLPETPLRHPKTLQRAPLDLPRASS